MHCWASCSWMLCKAGRDFARVAVPTEASDNGTSAWWKIYPRTVPWQCLQLAGRVKRQCTAPRSLLDVLTEHVISAQCNIFLLVCSSVDLANTLFPKQVVEVNAVRKFAIAFANKQGKPSELEEGTSFEQNLLRLGSSLQDELVRAAALAIFLPHLHSSRVWGCELHHWKMDLIKHLFVAGIPTCRGSAHDRAGCGGHQQSGTLCPSLPRFL